MKKRSADSLYNAVLGGPGQGRRADPCAFRKEGQFTPDWEASPRFWNRKADTRAG